MPHLKMEMGLLNTRHVASSTRRVGDLIFSEPIFTVEHERRCCDSLLLCSPVTLQLESVGSLLPTTFNFQKNSRKV
jgi:hypothetical protein